MTKQERGQLMKACNEYLSAEINKFSSNDELSKLLCAPYVEISEDSLNMLLPIFNARRSVKYLVGDVWIHLGRDLNVSHIEVTHEGQTIHLISADADTRFCVREIVDNILSFESFNHISWDKYCKGGDAE